MKTILRTMLLPSQACSALCLLVTGCCRQIPLTLLHNTPHRHYLETEEGDELFPESNLPCLSIHADDLPATRATKPVPYAKTSSYKMSQSYEAAKYGLRHMRSMRKFTGLPVAEGPVNFLQLQNILNVWCSFQVRETLQRDVLWQTEYRSCTMIQHE